MRDLTADVAVGSEADCWKQAPIYIDGSEPQAASPGSISRRVQVWQQPQRRSHEGSTDTCHGEGRLGCGCSSPQSWEVTMEGWGRQKQRHWLILRMSEMAFVSTALVNSWEWKPTSLHKPGLQSRVCGESFIENVLSTKGEGKSCRGASLCRFRSAAGMLRFEACHLKRNV